MVSNGVIAIRATLTSRSCLAMHAHIPESIDPVNWPANSQYLNRVGFSVWSTFATEVVSLEVARHGLSKVRSVKLLSWDQSQHTINKAIYQL